MAEPRYRNLRPDGAQWLARLVLDEGLHNVVELGTSNGYSTLHLGGALAHTDGRLISYEKHADRAMLAREMVRVAGLAKIVEVATGDGVIALAKHTQPVDLLFMDIWPADYIAAFQNARNLLRPGSCVVVDNLESHRDSSGTIQSAASSGAPEYLDFVLSQAGCTSVKLDMGSGMLLTRVADFS